MGCSDKYSFILSSIREFNSEKNIEKASSNMLGKILCTYNFDRVNLFFNDRVDEKFRCLTTILPDENRSTYSVKYNENIDINNYNIFVVQRNENREKIIFDMFLKGNFIYTKNINSIKEELEALDFSYANDNITEFFLGALIDKQEVLAYVTMEKYHEGYMTEINIEELETIVSSLSLRMIEAERSKEIRKKHTIEKAMSETTDFERQLMIVEKETYNLLFFNDYIEHSEELDSADKKCYKVMHNLTEPCFDCPIINNELNKSIYTVKDFQTHGEYGEYIIRVSEINWKSENDAYIVTTINATKFVKDKMNTDMLTGHLTWYGLKDKIKNEITMTDRLDKFAYISIDVDQLKLINDTHSRIVGNEILKQISLLIHDIAEEDEYYCRVVADTFALIIKYVDNENLNKRVERLETVLTQVFRSVFSEISLVVTGGIYIIENNLFDNLDLAYENTKLARSTIKGNYKNTFVLYDENLKKELKTSKHIEDKVVSAIENNEFVVYLQPKFELSTRKVIGAEALARWQSQEEMIFPDKFIPIFEKNGFVLTLDFIVYEKVFKFIRECLDENLDIMPISINASRNHLRGDDFLARFLKLLNKYEIPRHLVEIEITENASEDSDNKLREFVEQVRHEKIAVSMDDFGSAYSSLNLLKTLYVDTLKLDKEFLDKISLEKKENTLARDEIIIKNVVNMAKELDFNVICEGIEREEQIEFLKNIGCDYGQGYIFSKPLPLEEFKDKFL